MKSQYVLPITIVVAGALIAGAVFLLGKGSVPTQGGNGDGDKITARAYDPNVDHILCNPDAPVKVVEYADLGTLQKRYVDHENAVLVRFILAL